MIHKKHIEEQTFLVGFNTDIVDFGRLYEELELFAEAWPSCRVEVAINYVSFSYRGAQAYQKCDDASEQFRKSAKRHIWWEEVQL